LLPSAAGRQGLVLGFFIIIIIIIIISVFSQLAHTGPSTHTIWQATKKEVMLDVDIDSAQNNFSAARRHVKQFQCCQIVRKSILVFPDGADNSRVARKYKIQFQGSQKVLNSIPGLPESAKFNSRVARKCKNDSRVAR